MVAGQSDPSRLQGHGGSLEVLTGAVSVASTGQIEYSTGRVLVLYNVVRFNISHFIIFASAILYTKCIIVTVQVELKLLFIARCGLSGGFVPLVLGGIYTGHEVDFCRG